ncbi:malonyl-CoA decarboxylase [Futiania mangrovi]|uniref:Malonyl-CoA decarboxylase n=1 Tax=Futiania mangrovi TaxID=2959716 RepID=A0A9J6PDV0_9PROT|nr:malonyl-CoA decarboxylase [Futiania mangrovii]MCP1336566.1 malonyl-CoA decarboxylase [Futiania mangrovii]
MNSFLRDLLGAFSDGRRWLADVTGRKSVTHDQLVELAEALLSGRGEASGVAIAQEVLRGYGTLTGEARTAFFATLAERFGPDRERLAAAAEGFLAADGPDAQAEAALQRASEPRRLELIRRLNLAPGGTAALVSMREDLLAVLRDRPDLHPVDADFQYLFTSWFNRGFLTLRRMDWDTPASILEKIIRYEAVHEIQGWDDLKRRIDMPDRRLYAFFHPALADEPLIFVQVALMDEMADAIAPVLATDRETVDGGHATTAIFYSISNTQVGLRGISFGNFLIKQVVEDLSREFPSLKTFATLSPVPGFRRWLDGEIAKGGEAVRALPRAADILPRLSGGDWIDDPAADKEMKPALQALASHYFLVARSPTGKVIDPVARFHLGNGARLERINWRADLSEKGRRQSHGLMVNYLYDLKDIERNHEIFANKGEVVAAPAIARHLKALSLRKTATAQE